MAARPPSRILILTSLIVAFFLFIFLFRQQAPLSPEARAPGHLDKLGANVAIDADMLAGEGIMPKLGNETAKYVLCGYGLPRRGSFLSGKLGLIMRL